MASIRTATSGEGLTLPRTICCMWTGLIPILRANALIFTEKSSIYCSSVSAITDANLYRVINQCQGKSEWNDKKDLQSGHMNVGQRFKELRILKGFPKAGNVATFLGLPRSTVSAFENNQSSPSIETIRKFIDPLDITLAEFFESRLPKEFWRSPHRELLEMVIEILDSGDELIAGSLKSNILSSSDSIK
jgi:transcriptional regulator with XRE-family HTH domain